MIYSIPKLCIQNYLPSTTKYENKCFFLYSNSGFEYRIKKMKSRYTIYFKTKQALNSSRQNWTESIYTKAMCQFNHIFLG